MRRLVTLITMLAVLTGAVVVTRTRLQAARQDPTILSFLTTGASVQLRAAPRSDAPVVAVLPLGTEVTVLPSVPAGDWRRVTSPSFRTGWIVSRFLMPLDATRRTETVMALAGPRLPDAVTPAAPVVGSVADLQQVVTLIEQTLLLEADRSLRAALSWYHLRAMAAALRAVAAQPVARREDRTWIDARGATVQPTIGGWIVRPAFVRALHARYADTAAADDIAWFLVEQGLGGECEGDVPCMVRALNETAGEYLRWHPTGRHVDAAIGRIGDTLDEDRLALSSAPGLLPPAPDRCGEMANVLAPLSEAVERSRGREDSRVRTAATLERTAARCR